MKIKTQLTLASVVAAGLLASGCSSQQVVAQHVSQHASQEVAVVNQMPAPAPVTTESMMSETVVNKVIDCSSCRRAAPRPQPKPRPRNNNMHGHPAVPGCTAAVQHAHPRPQGGHHNHKYGCKKAAPRRPVKRPAPRVNKHMHSHPAVPNCTNAVNHAHPGGNGVHNHRYACQRPRPVQRPVYRPQPVQRPVYRPQPVQRPVYRPQPVQRPMPIMPKVKAKGTYKGPISIDGVMNQYQQ